MIFKMKIILPTKLNFNIIKIKKINTYIIYSEFFFYKQTLHSSTNIIFKKNINTLVLEGGSINILKNIFKKHLTRLLFSLNFYFFKKFKIKGKGFRIYRRSKNRFIKYFLGHSHFKITQFNNCILLKLTKYKFMVLNSSKNLTIVVKKIIQQIKPLNLYTKRGLRAIRQKVTKRRGKSLIF